MAYKNLRYVNTEKTDIDCLFKHPTLGEIPYTLNTKSDEYIVLSKNGLEIADYIAPLVDETVVKAEQERREKALAEAKAKSQVNNFCQCKDEIEALKKQIETLQAEVKKLEQKSTQLPPTQTSSPSIKPPVNINTAAWEQIEPLPLIGMTGAKSVVSEREKNGKFIDHADFKKRTRYDFTTTLKDRIRF